MSLEMKKHVSRRDVWIEKILKIISALKLSKFCCMFTLRQGTILIAIIELSLTSFSLFLLLLSVTHAQDIVTLVTSDLQRLEEYNLSQGRIEESSAYFTNNEKKMLIGQHIALFMTFTIWSGLLLTSIQFISCILLLYGAIRRLTNFILVWIATGLFSLISGFFCLIMVAFVPFYGCKLGVYAILLPLYGTQIYSWLIVFSYYQELKSSRFKGFGGVLHNIGDPEKELTTPQSTQTLKPDIPL